MTSLLVNGMWLRGNKVPEPMTLVLVDHGFVGVAGIRKKFKN